MASIMEVPKTDGDFEIIEEEENKQIEYVEFIEFDQLRDNVLTLIQNINFHTNLNLEEQVYENKRLNKILNKCIKRIVSNMNKSKNDTIYIINKINNIEKKLQLFNKNFDRINNNINIKFKSY